MQVTRFPHSNDDDLISPSFRGGILVLILLIGHALVMMIPVRWIAPEIKKEEPIAVEKWVEPSSEDQREVVQSSKLKEQEETDAKPRFYGEFKNRTKEETQAPLTGRFQEHRKFGMTLPGLDGEESVPPGMWGIPSQSPNLLPEDVRKGQQTVLNTDPLRYASFLNRIADQIRDPWERFVREALLELSLRNVKLEEDVYETRLVVFLSRDGEITGMQKLTSSGYDEFDAAAKEAFWRTEPFKNPPNQMFKAEAESVRLEYSFNVQLKSAGLSIIPRYL